jgi:hypothetical protein
MATYGTEEPDEEDHRQPIQVRLGEELASVGYEELDDVLVYSRLSTDDECHHEKNDEADTGRGS